MNSVGSEVDNYLRVVRTTIDALGMDLESALAQIPEDFRHQVRARWEEQFAQPIRPARILVAKKGPRAWIAEWDPAKGYYWIRQRNYLIDKFGRTEKEIETLDDSTDKILHQLEDPRATGLKGFRTQGLVMGYVQSGKTANFSALIAKAADLGYKLVIVLSGIHNALRQQTQRRLGKELGLIAADGVGLPEPGKRWISLTTSDLSGDFHPGTTSPDVLQGNEHVIAVVKKNASVLRRFLDWIEGHAPHQLPVLIVDDEADQASINTGGNRPPLEEIADLTPDDVDEMNPDEELNPSIINGLVRRLIRSFGRVAYIGYTATPFANVLISPNAADLEMGDDLYPRDFIVSLPRPAGYVGAQTLFGSSILGDGTEEVSYGLGVIEKVPDVDAELLVPSAAQIGRFQPVLPGSLKAAILDFLLATAARAARGNPEAPCSMLIHTHHRTVVQNLLGAVVKEHIGELRQKWRYDRETIRPDLQRRWESNFENITRNLNANKVVLFPRIEEELDRLLRNPLNVYVLNSSSEDTLDYEAEPNLKVILIGGNRLSRGLTLEGLLVSYYVRRVEYLDALMQMGRWFGYRESYVDLTRLYTTKTLLGFFRDLSGAEEELRLEIERYEKDGLTPLDFYPKIRAHPVMLITAPNKMGSAIEVSQNYAGKLIQTINFRLNDFDWLNENLQATRKFLSQLDIPDESGGGRPTWHAVANERILQFLIEYKGDQNASFVDFPLLRNYVREKVRIGELVRWHVSVVGLETRDPELLDEDLGIVGSGSANCISRSRLRGSDTSIGALINPAILKKGLSRGDELVGLSDTQITQAQNIARSEGKRFGDALREQRDPREGLLLIYPISKYSKAAEREGDRVALFDRTEARCTVIGVSIVFPANTLRDTIVYLRATLTGNLDG